MRQPEEKGQNYEIFDRVDEVQHRGPWKKGLCLAWMALARQLFPRGVDDVFEVRKINK